MTAQTSSCSIWQRLWEYDPNGLLVLDADLYVRLVNPAFCRMFQVQEADIVGQSASLILDDLSDFKKVWQQNITIQGKFKEFPEYQLFVDLVIFPIEEEGVIACIMVDMTSELKNKRELNQIKRDTIQRVNEVVDNQMKVVQEIAGLLGETTAKTKVSLLKIIQVLEQDRF